MTDLSTNSGRLQLRRGRTSEVFETLGGVAFKVSCGSLASRFIRRSSPARQHLCGLHRYLPGDYRKPEAEKPGGGFGEDDESARGCPPIKVV